MSVALITATIALVSALVTAAVTGWLSARAKVSEELRELRLSHYPPVWKRTSLFSRWPQTNATYDDLEQLHLDLRRWYYGLGGVVLSENARDRYGELQAIAGTHLEHDGKPGADELLDDTYDDLKEVASAFRSALTEDLESRRQRSLWWTLRRSRLHGRQKADAARRRKAAEAGAGARPVCHVLAPEELRLDEPEAPPTAGDAAKPDG